MLSDLFEDAGFSVREAANAAEAISILLREQSCIDVLLTDIRMPGASDGLALASWTREHCPDAKVVIMSGYVGEHALQPGACDAFVRKPFDPPKIVGIARSLLAATRDEYPSG
jgi:CheY-like chemotaxis protein